MMPSELETGWPRDAAEVCIPCTKRRSEWTCRVLLTDVALSKEKQKLENAAEKEPRPPTPQSEPGEFVQQQRSTVAEMTTWEQARYTMKLSKVR